MAASWPTMKCGSEGAVTIAVSWTSSSQSFSGMPSRGPVTMAGRSSARSARSKVSPSSAGSRKRRIVPRIESSQDFTARAVSLAPSGLRTSVCRGGSVEVSSLPAAGSSTPTWVGVVPRSEVNSRWSPSTRQTSS